MSTVLGFPDATSPTPETGVLWFTEGSGTTRDKKIAAGTLVRDLLGVAIVGQPPPTETLDGTETLPIVQAGVGRETTLLSAADAVVVNAPAGGALDTSRILVDQSGLAGLPITDFVFRGVDLSKAGATPPMWDSIVTAGVDTPWVDVCGTGWISVVRTPSLFHGPRFDIEVYATFKNVAGSSTNGNGIVLQIPLALFPTGWWTEISEILALERSGQVWPIIVNAVHQTNETPPSRSSSLVIAKQVSTDLCFDFSSSWSALMPVSDKTGAHIHCSVSLLPHGLAAIL